MDPDLEKKKLSNDFESSRGAGEKSLGKVLDLKNLKLPELVALCKEKGIKGYSGKKKAEVLELLKKVTSTPEPNLEEKQKEEKKLTSKKSQTSQKVLPTLPPPSRPKLLPTPRGSSGEVLGKKYPEVCPNFPGLFGFDEITPLFYKWLKEKASVSYLYGPAGVGKSCFIWRLLEAIGVKGIEVDSFNMDILASANSLVPRVAVWDDCEKPGKPPLGIKTHLIIIGRDKFTYVPKESLHVCVSKPRVASLAKWLLPKYPSYTIDQLNNLCKLNDGDIRHILMTLKAGVFTDCEKDMIVQKDAFSATGALFNTSLSLDKRIENASLEPDMTLCMVFDALPKSGIELEDVLKGLDSLSYTDCLHHQEGRWMGVVDAVQRAGPTKMPFLLFPSWYGKYSKGEKHKRWLGSWKKDLDTMLVLRNRIVEFANEVPEEGDALVKRVSKEIHKHGLLYGNLFEELDEFLFEGSEISDFTDDFKAKLKKLEDKDI